MSFRPSMVWLTKCLLISCCSTILNDFACIGEATCSQTATPLWIIADAFSFPVLSTTKRMSTLPSSSAASIRPSFFFGNQRIHASEGSDDEHKESPFDLETHLHILDQSLRQQTSTGILDRMQTWMNSGDSSSSSIQNPPPSLEEIQSSMRFALISHGAEETVDGALHNYGNFGALAAYQVNRTIFMEIPARKMANVGLHQQQLENLLDIMKESGSDSIFGNNNALVMEPYNGFRCTTNLETFYIKEGVIWNCYDESDQYYGQALLFDRELVDFM